MRLESYNYRLSLKFLQYEFESVGPKGKITKVVRFNRMKGGSGLYNLAFGDLDEKTGDIDDFITSDNNDREKILATVAKTVIDFTQNRPEVLVFATDSTGVRTRLYRIGIFLHWREINPLFYVWGSIDGKWEFYQPNRPYEAFLVKRR